MRYTRVKIRTRERNTAYSGSTISECQRSESMSRSKRRSRLAAEPVFVTDKAALRGPGAREDERPIYMLRQAYQGVNQLICREHTGETGGVLTGTAAGRSILIRGFIEAKYSQGTPAALAFTRDTWTYIQQERGRKFPGQTILGWVQIRPNLGVELTEYDRFVQTYYFGRSYQFLYVIDPIQRQEGIYRWCGEELVRYRGLYVVSGRPGRSRSGRGGEG